MNALALAFGLLTAFPVRRLPQVDARAAGRAMVLAPLTTAPLVAVVWAAHLWLSSTPLLAGAIVVAAGALWTRGLHLDGLADTADGLSVQGDPQRRLAAMKASDIGPSGVSVLVLALLAQVAALAALLPTQPWLVAVAWPTSRLALSWACHRLVPAAMPDGLGALVAGSVGTVPALLWTLLAVTGAALIDPVAGPAMVAAALVSALLLLRRATTRFGGITGDVLGACVESALTAALVVAAVIA